MIYQQKKNQQPGVLKKAPGFTALLIVALTIHPFISFAQTALPEADGKPLAVPEPTTDVDGSIYLKLDWTDGTISRKDGTEYKGLKLRYDIYDDQVVFEGSDDKSLVPVFTDIADFTLKDTEGMDNMKMADGFPPVDGQTTSSFYEVLSAGKTKLLKHYSRTIKQQTDMGQPTGAKSFDDKQTYYVFKNGTMTAVKPDEKDISDALADKGAQITAMQRPTT